MADRVIRTFGEELWQTLAQIGRERRQNAARALTGGIADIAPGRGHCIVEVDGDSGSGDDDGELVDPVGNGLFSGTIVAIQPTEDFSTADAYVAGAACWIAVINRFTGSIVPGCQLPAGERYIAVPFGRIGGDDSEDERPLYIVQKADSTPGIRLWWGTLSADLASADEEAEVDNIEEFMEGQGVPAITVCENRLNWSGHAGDVCVIAENTAGDSSGEAYQLMFVAWDVLPTVENVFDDDPAIKQTHADRIGKRNEETSSDIIFETDDECPEGSSS